MKEIKKTSELLNILNRTSEQQALQRYIENIETDHSLSFTEYFSELLEQRKLSRAELVTRSGIERTYLYQLLNGTRSPGRDHLLRLSIGAGLSLEETTRCLELLSLGILYAKNPRDAVLIYCINRNMNLDETNALLYDMKEAPLS